MESMNVIDAIIDITRTAYEAAVAAGENWADSVDFELQANGCKTLDAVAYSAELDTNLIAVVEVDGRPVGVRCDDDGTWSECCVGLIHGRANERR